MPDPFLIAGGIALLATLPGRGMSGGGPVSPADAASFAAGARFPLPAWGAYRPTVSSGYREPTRPSHFGVDVMFHRAGGSGAPDARFPAGTPDGSRGFFCPPGTTVHAVRDGYVWESGKGGTGLFVVLDHGAPFATFYVHLESLLIPSGVTRGAGRIEVKAGQPIGTVGYSPRDAAKLRHLHFEVWYRGGSAAHVDPWPLIKDAPLP